MKLLQAVIYTAFVTLLTHTSAQIVIGNADYNLPTFCRNRDIFHVLGGSSFTLDDYVIDMRFDGRIAVAGEMTRSDGSKEGFFYSISAFTCALEGQIHFKESVPSFKGISAEPIGLNIVVGYTDETTELLIVYSVAKLEFVTNFSYTVP